MKPDTQMHHRLKGFFEIPGFQFLYINKKGVVWDEYFKEYLRPYIAQRPYPEVKADGAIKPISIHRALALTFLECPGNPVNLHVDHKDGNKMNYSLSNLEWVTRSENCIRAIKKGARRDNRPVMLKDLETGEVHEFHGVNECGRYLKIHPGYISTYFKRPQAVPFRGKYELIKKGDPWKGFTAADIGKSNQGATVTIVAYDCAKNEAVIFGSVEKAVEYTGVNRNLIRDHCTRSDLTPVNGFQFCYVGDFKGNVKEARYVRSGRSANFDKNRFVKTERPLLVKKLSSGEVLEYQSTSEFAETMGVDKKTVQKAIGNNAGYYKDYYLQYKPKSLPSERVR